MKSSISAPDRLSCLLDDEDPARCRQLLRETVFEHVELFYHRIRMHSALGYRTPMQAEWDYQTVRTVS